MTTDKIMVYSEGPGIDKALAETERFAQYEKLGEKDGLYLRLLSEEMLGMVRGITGGFEGQFWLEGGDGECRICLRADTYMDRSKKKKLIALSASGKNESSVGIMEMLRNILVNVINDPDSMDDLSKEYDDGSVMYGMMGARSDGSLDPMDFEWSLIQYKSMVEKDKQQKKSVEAWDELEKSIVANIADDVKVGVRGDIVEMTIIKRFD